MWEKIKNIDKGIIAAIVIIVGIIAVVALYYYLVKYKVEEPARETEQTMEEILNSLSAPPGSVEPIPKETLNSLSAKSPGSEIPEDVLESLSVPE